MSAAAFGMLLYAGAQTASAAGADSADTLPAGGPLYGYFREARGAAVPAQQTDRFARSAPGLGARVDASPSDLLARLHYAFGSNLGLSSEHARQDEELVVRNSDAFVQAKVRLTLSKEWRGFVYADIGTADSGLRWQGLAGIHARLGVDLLGGWRHVTYHFSPGRGFDSLEFNGPFLGAALAW
jgi:hypothetical protein